MNYKEFNDNEILSYVSENNEEALELIYEKYKPLINKIASNLFKKYCKNTGLELSDLIQEGMIGLNSAINHYKENKDTLFYTYARTCIERRIISTVVGAHRQKHRILNESLSFEVNLTDTELNLDFFLKDNNYNPENIVIDRENSEELMKEIENTLSPYEQQVLQLKLDGFNYKEIAGIVDRDPKDIDNAIQRIKIKIKKMLEK